MTTYTYDPTVPAANNAPRNDQPVMQTNAVSIQGIISVDHENFGIATNGYHTVIHQRTGAGTQDLTRSGSGSVYANIPANIPGVNQLLAGLYTPDTTGGSADTQLFSLTGNAGISQLTGSHTASDGWCWAGGILIQWGRFTPGGGTFPSGTNVGSIIFKDRVVGAIPFPNNCFMITASPSTLSTTLATTTASVIILSNTVSKNGFSFEFFSSTNVYNGFYWVAVGN
jgi:hypothetical protein